MGTINKVLGLPNLPEFELRARDVDGVPMERRDQMIECDVPFDPLRVKGVLGQDREAAELGLVLPGLWTLLSIWRLNGHHDRTVGWDANNA
ncbi:hypothetical protein HAX54_053367 [Datura stramonium]|uniref:Uncharacterized protein n=1 Tax=Datura stramonium TaxID=4076 RepID=A0ABS8T0U8_DATST|nr:hypothetical protein [Datura stramonium]